MPDPHFMENDFTIRLKEIVEENLSNEQFGVSELAQEVGMSRSNLLRKVKKLSKLSVSQFIRQIRLRNAMDILRKTSFTVSEVSFQVGFNSISYFIKCFHDYFGYPPGEVGKKEFKDNNSVEPDQKGKKRLMVIVGSIIILAIICILIVFKPFSSVNGKLEKSIAVLPFKNDSSDSTNIYIVNGLMESILNNLQKIEDFRVISRTSVEKYRTAPQIIPEIAKELNVNYFVEGSGQKIGNEILLNIQLIEAKTDKHLWSEQYKREAKDIFSLQQEVAENIAKKIQAIITPEEMEQLQKVPTENLLAYDYFLKGLDLMFKEEHDDLLAAVDHFKKAIELDTEFARAFADLSIAYAFLDIYQTERKYSDSINHYADQALLLDPQLTQSLIAKALYYRSIGEYKVAIPYLEKALEYNPNSALVINILSDFYANIIPDTEKYLEFALKGIRIDISAHDSLEASVIYLHLSNALVQTGFTNEAEYYINKSLDYSSDNLFSQYVKAYILYSKNSDLQQTKELLIEVLSKDSTRLDVLQEVGKICYFMRDYESAYKYYKIFDKARKVYNLDIFRSEDAKIGVVQSKLGLTKESDLSFERYLDYAENDKSIYKNLSLAVYYSFKGDTEKALRFMKLFSQEDNYHYWTILFLRIDPLVDNMKDLPEFTKILEQIESKFWSKHKEIKATLDRKGLL